MAEQERETHWDALPARVRMVVRRHWPPGALIIAACVMLAIIHSAWSVPLYRARASLLVEPRVSQLMPDYEIGYFNLREEMDALRLLARSQPVLERAAVNAGNLAREAALPLAPGEAQILAGSDTRTEGKLLVLEVEHPDPKLAAILAGGWQRAVEDDAQRREQASNAYLEDSLRKLIPDLRAEWEREEKRRQDFIRAQQFDPSALNEHPLRMRFDGLNKELCAAQMRLDLLRGEAMTWEGAADRPGLLTSLPRARRNAELRTFEQDLYEAQRKLLALQQQYQSDAPAVKRQADSLAALGQLRGEVLARLKAELDAEKNEAGEQVRAISEALEKLRPEYENLRAKWSEYSLLALNAEVARKRYEDSVGRHGAAELAKNVRFSYVRAWEGARPPAFPSKPDWGRNITFGLLLGCLLAAAAIYLLEVLDSSVRSPKQLERRLGLEVIGSVPAAEPHVLGENAYLLAVKRPRALILEALRTVRHAVSTALNGQSDGLAPAVLISSPGEGEGKSFLAANLAMLYAQTGKRTLLIDADLYKGTLTRRLNLAKAPGLATLVMTTEAPDLASLVCSTDLEGFFVLPCGSLERNQSAHLLEGAGFLRVLEQARRGYQIVLLDSPPLLAVADAVALAAHCTLALVVCRSRQTRLDQVSNVAQILERAGARKPAYLVNGLDPLDALSDGYGSRYYSYAYPASRPETEGEK